MSFSGWRFDRVQFNYRVYPINSHECRGFSILLPIFKLSKYNNVFCFELLVTYMTNFYIPIPFLGMFNFIVSCIRNTHYELIMYGVIHSIKSSVYVTNIRLRNDTREFN